MTAKQTPCLKRTPAAAPRTAAPRAAAFLILPPVVLGGAGGAEPPRRNGVLYFGSERLSRVRARTRTFQLVFRRLLESARSFGELAHLKVSRQCSDALRFVHPCALRNAAPGATGERHARPTLALAAKTNGAAAQQGGGLWRLVGAQPMPRSGSVTRKPKCLKKRLGPGSLVR